MHNFADEFLSIHVYEYKIFVFQLMISIFRASLISWWEYRPHFHLYETYVRVNFLWETMYDYLHFSLPPLSRDRIDSRTQRRLVDGLGSVNVSSTNYCLIFGIV